MKKFVTLGVITSALMAPMMASAATTADLKLIGTITPAACVPNFTGGTTIDYGNIPAGTLNATAQTNLPDKTTKLTVTCNAPVKFGFSMIDNRAASAVTSLTTISGADNEAKLGLGSAGNGAKIGAYSMQISNETPDTGTTQRLRSSDGGTTWVVFGGILTPSYLYGFANSSTATAPSAHTSITVDIKVVAAIDKASNLPITSEIKIDGLSTFEVKYL